MFKAHLTEIKRSSGVLLLKSRAKSDGFTWQLRGKEVSSVEYLSYFLSASDLDSSSCISAEKD